MTSAANKRLEDPRLLAGRGRYVDDVVRAGMLHAVVVRSAYAHAPLRRDRPARRARARRIRSASRARARPARRAWAALANAVANAVGPAAARQLPMTASRVLAALDSTTPSS